MTINIQKENKIYIKDSLIESCIKVVQHFCRHMQQLELYRHEVVEQVEQLYYVDLD